MNNTILHSSTPKNVGKKLLLALSISGMLSGCLSDSEDNNLQLQNERLMAINDSLMHVLSTSSVATLERNSKFTKEYFANLKIKSNIENIKVEKFKTITKIEDAIIFLREEHAKGHHLLLDGSQQYQLYKDSLVLANLDAKNDSIEQVYDQTIEYGESHLTNAEEAKLNDFFIDYVEGRYKGKRKSNIRTGRIKKEVIGGVTLYYKETNDGNPASLAKHNTIKPSNIHYTFSQISPYHTADIYANCFDAPVNKCISIPKNIFTKCGITDEKQMQEILDKINNNSPTDIKSPAIPEVKDTLVKATTPPPVKKPVEAKVYSKVQQYKIKTNGAYQLNILDYGEEDGDQIAIPTTGDTVAMGKKNISIDLRKLKSKRVLIEILNEGKMPPNTLLVKIGDYEKQLKGIKGELIILDFE